MDGRSLMPLLGATPPAPEEWRQAFLFEQYVGDHRLERDPLGEPPDPFDIPRFASVPLFYSGLRTATLKYIEYDNGERELYDLVNDPYELENQYRQHAAQRCGVAVVLAVQPAHLYYRGLPRHGDGTAAADRRD